MVLFGQHPSQGTLLKASQFLSEELPIRLSHRVVELESLPDGLSRMPSIEKVKEWYAQSFEVSGVNCKGAWDKGNRKRRGWRLCGIGCMTDAGGQEGGNER